MAALAACLAVANARAMAAQTAATASQSSSKPREASVEEYRSHLLSLSTLVQACAKARDMKACAPAQVGPDDLVPVAPAQSAPRRLIRYGWLRVLLSKAQDKDVPPPKGKPAATPTSRSWENVRPIPRTTTELLEDARIRLGRDAAQVGRPPAPRADHTAERQVMTRVLAGREFSGLEEITPKDSALEKVGNWLNRVLESAMKASARAPWLGRALVWGFIAVVCLGLIGGLLRLERRWRSRLVRDDHALTPGAPSAVSWQIWLENARRAAATADWRQAIHLLYWAAISGLESKRLWPADRARTPREYLALMSPRDPRQLGLATLTGSFERVWYGGRPAEESDYRQAEHMATALIYGLEIHSSKMGITEIDGSGISRFDREASIAGGGSAR